MNSQMNLILALNQIENISKLLQDGPYAGFFSSHLLPIRFEIERQLSLLTNSKSYSKIEE